MVDLARLDELLLDWQERRQQGQRALPQHLRADCPELLDPLRQRIRDLESAEAFLGVGGGDTPCADDLRSHADTPPALDEGEDVRALLAPPQGPGEMGRLGPYAVLGVLGAGGMGLVLRARDPVLRRDVALKVMRPALAAEPHARERFLREGRAAAAVEHEHAVPIYHVGEEGAVPFLVMPLLQGETLADRLRREGPLPIDEVVRIGAEAAEGLAAAHARGLVHRDVKPANLWLEALGGKVKVLDFGLAHWERDGRLTEVGAVRGTPAYMSPEQVRGEALGPACDLFSLGVVLYEMATGQPPFRGKNALALLAALASDEPVPPEQLRPGLPPALGALIRELLVKDEARRPSSAPAIAARLRDVGQPRPRKVAWTRGAVLVAVLLAVGAGGPLAWRAWPGPVAEAPSPGVEGRPTPPAPAAKPLEGPLEGTLQVRVWAPKLSKRGLLVGFDERAVPLREDDQIQLVVKLSRPAYPYLLWLDGKGEVTPLYPWNGDKLDVRSVSAPPPVALAAELRNPSREVQGWPLDDTAGLDTILLLARDQPWPSDRNLGELLGKVPEAPAAHPGEVVVRGWDRGMPVPSLSLDRNRRPKANATAIDDQLAVVVDRLHRDFEVIRAVRFAHVAKD